MLLSGDEDDPIAEIFIEETFPEPQEFDIVLLTLGETEKPLSKKQLLKRANFSWKAASQCSDMNRIDNAAIRVEEGFKRTSADWKYDQELYESVTQQRCRELKRLFDPNGTLNRGKIFPETAVGQRIGDS